MEEKIKEKMAEQNKEDFPEARKFLNNRVKKISFIIIVFLLGSFAVLVLARVPHAVEKQKTEEAIAKIHATKLTMADVMGENLPPDPGEAADDTIEGIDANQNGIRDDVELAIFKEYPHSAKIRAALLQYALALQMGFRPEVINMEIVTEAAREQSRAVVCIGDVVAPRQSPESWRSYTDIEKIDKFIVFIKNLQINTQMRNEFRDFLLDRISSYSESINTICDVKLES